MKASPKVREARKAAHKARLENKGKKNYAKLYAEQPLQKAKAEKNEEIRSARQSVRDANEALALAEVTGEGLKTAQENLAVANLVVEKLVTAKRARPGAGLSAA